MGRLLLVSLLFRTATCVIVLWTPRPYYLPALKPFTDGDYAKLVKDMGNPAVVAFQSESLEQAAPLQKALHNNTLYLLQPEIDLPDVEVQEITEFTTADPSALVILTIANPRFKRSSDNASLDETFVSVNEQIPTGPVLYSYSDKKEGVLLYSSKPPALYLEDGVLHIGNASTTFLDVRGTLTRLIARISMTNNRAVFLRFIFTVTGGYWYLNSVEAEVYSVKYNLGLVSGNVTAPNRVSYHCEGKTTFADVKSNISLDLYDLQVQPDAVNRRFGDAYNCIPFTTAPILSGLFVTAILLVGLGVGLMALASIKSMDKFDNAKTKQLTVTLFD